MFGSLKLSGASIGFFVLSVCAQNSATAQTNPQSERRKPKIDPPAFVFVDLPPITTKEAMERVAKPSARTSDIRPEMLHKGRKGEPIETLPVTPRSGHELPVESTTPSGLKRADFARVKGQSEQSAAPEALSGKIPGPVRSPPPVELRLGPATHDLPFESK